MLRAVVDVNVIVSGLLSRGGTPANVLRRWAAGDFELVVSDHLVAELERVLSYRKIRERIDAADASAFAGLLRASGYRADDPPDPPVTPSPDRDDDYLVALAEVTRSLIVTGDAALLELSGRLPVYTPRQFLDLLDT